MKSYFAAMLALAFLVASYAYAEETTNERLIRVEESIKSLDQRLSQRIDDTNQKIEYLRDDISNLRAGITSLNQTLFFFFFAILAIIIWDRRTALQPLKNDISAIKEKLKVIWDHFRFDKKTTIIPSA
ncbi:MAG: hypothetical protein HQK75_07080 [Candidatus Magnetomorum sp.]|nr:hypothetical protein [Candidatus Magnetomorum sp.]